MVARIRDERPNRVEPEDAGGDGGGGGGRSTLTFPQLVLEVRVTPSLSVEIDAVADEQSPAHPRGDRAGLPAHHGCRNPVGWRRIRGSIWAISVALGRRRLSAGLDWRSGSGKGKDPGRTPHGPRHVTLAAVRAAPE